MLQTSDYIDSDLQNVTGATRFTWKASDGITLSAHLWEPEEPREPTVLCLPGLTRNTRDFYHLANFLKKNGLRVIAMDYRGRGLSDHSDDFRTYSLSQEADDIDRGIEALALRSLHSSAPPVVASMRSLWRSATQSASCPSLSTISAP